ncbi:MAG: hypothetical protein IKL48_04960 [Elusimicrobiaceae bacterium]|nr:hypothetical protein [Elusimicrobiaceae bacterium]
MKRIYMNILLGFIVITTPAYLTANENQTPLLTKVYAQVERASAQAAQEKRKEDERKNGYVSVVWSVQKAKQYRIRRFGGLGGGKMKLGWGAARQEKRRCLGEIIENRGVVVEKDCILPENYQDKSFSLISAQVQHKETGKIVRLGKLKRHANKQNLRVFLFEN